MLILGLDLAGRTGYALGAHDTTRPATGAWSLVKDGEDLDMAAARLGGRLRDLFEIARPDQVWVENYIATNDHPDQDSLKIALFTRGAVRSICYCYDVPMFDVAVSTARKQFCGKASAHPPRRPTDPPWTQQEIRRRRRDTKQMIWNEARRQGLIADDVREDFERSDAACVWSFGACRAGRVPPFRLV